MKTALSREEIRELDRKAIEEYKIPGIILMENAGRNVAEEVLLMINEPSETNVAVLAGKGNNGGDGFVIARHLHNRGISVNVFLVAKISDILKDGDASLNLQILLNMEIPVREIINIDEVFALLENLHGYSLLIDALFGTGLSGEVREPYKTFIQGINTLNVPLVSVDIPSGLDCNSGKVLGAAIKATKTVTFVVGKQGFYVHDGPQYVGDIVVTDISIPRKLIGQME